MSSNSSESFCLWQERVRVLPFFTTTIMVSTAPSKRTAPALHNGLVFGLSLKAVMQGQNRRACFLLKFLRPVNPLAYLLGSVFICANHRASKRVEHNQNGMPRKLGFDGISIAP